jgi:hypothetical protein
MEFTLILNTLEQVSEEETKTAKEAASKCR